jgi:hypothetical protein
MENDNEELQEDPPGTGHPCGLSGYQTRYQSPANGNLIHCTGPLASLSLICSGAPPSQSRLQIPSARRHTHTFLPRTPPPASASASASSRRDPTFSLHRESSRTQVTQLNSHNGAPPELHYSTSPIPRFPARFPSRACDGGVTVYIWAAPGAQCRSFLSWTVFSPENFQGGWACGEACES